MEGGSEREREGREGAISRVRGRGRVKRVKERKMVDRGADREKEGGNYIT
jgi:hypothetical protein